jgi:hypothetical protein
MGQKRSPLRDKPLRNPGQSVDEAREEMLFDRFVQPATYALVFVLLACLEWWRYWTDMPPAPWLFSVCALGALAYGGYRIRDVMPQLKALKLASDGEKAVGQYLERLREQGYRVFHDVVVPGFNIDHVLIGPAGIFTIETKTYSKPVGPSAKVHFDGTRLTVDGVFIDRDPVVQAKAQAGWLSDQLEDSIGRPCHVRPVVLFPGWYIEETGPKARDVWVLNPKAFPKFLERAPVSLGVEEISQASLHLARLIRTS